MPGKYAKTVDLRKFAKINPREDIKVLTRKSGYRQTAKNQKILQERLDTQIRENQ